MLAQLLHHLEQVHHRRDRRRHVPAHLERAAALSSPL
jgi:hypothetical protein